MSKSNTVAVSFNEFLGEFDAILDEFSEMEKEEINKQIRKIGNSTKKELQTETPAGAGKYKDWDEYQAGWTKSESTLNGNLTVTVGNKKKPQLTHLLEKGHVNAKGHGRTKAYPHVAPAAENAAKKLKEALS